MKHCMCMFLFYLCLNPFGSRLLSTMPIYILAPHIYELLPRVLQWKETTVKIMWFKTLQKLTLSLKKLNFLTKLSATTPQSFLEGDCLNVHSMVAKTRTMYFLSSSAIFLFARFSSVLSQKFGIGKGFGTWKYIINIIIYIHNNELCTATSKLTIKHFSVHWCTHWHYNKR